MMLNRIPPLAVIGLSALAGANALLLALVVRHAWRGEHEAVSAIAWKPKLSLAGLGTEQQRPGNDYAEILARPIFFKSRAPYVVPPPPLPAPPVPAAAPFNPDPGLMLAGVMIAGSAKKAYLVTKTDARGAWASEGEDLSGWKLRSISAATVILQQQDRTVELELYPPYKGDAAETPGRLPPQRPEMPDAAGRFPSRLGPPLGLTGPSR